jgi:hypothetical protein
MEDGERAFRCAASWGNIPSAWLALAEMYASDCVVPFKIISDLFGFRETCFWSFSSILHLVVIRSSIYCCSSGTAMRVLSKRRCCPSQNFFR